MIKIHWNDQRAAIKGKGGTVEPALLYKGKPMFKFGPLSETSTFAFKLGSTAYDLRMWAKWQKDNGMGYVRCYPEQGYGWVSTEEEGRLYPFKQVRPLIFDLDEFDQEYWDNFREVGKFLRDNDIVIHLQMVQVCYFKGWQPEARRWHCCYWNPENNVNEWTKNLEATFPFSDMNPQVLDHWKRYVEAILDAVGDLGNIILDLGNELDGEEDWIEWNLSIIEAWEKSRGVHVLKGLDYTHMENAVKILDDPRLEVIMTHGEFIDDAPLLRKLFGKPVVSVISRDSSYSWGGKNGYLGLGENEPNEDRFRWFHYRCMMNKVQGVGDYGKMMGGQEKKRTGDLGFSIVEPKSWRAEKFAREAGILKGLFDSIKDYESLSPNPYVLHDVPAGNKGYCLKSDKEAVIYLVGKGSDGEELKLSALSTGDVELYTRAEVGIMHPETGEYTRGKLERDEGVQEEVYKIGLPKFQSDVVVHIGIK